MKIWTAFLAVLILAVPARADELWPDLSQPPKGIGGGEKDAAVVVGLEKYAFLAGLPGARRNAEDWQVYLVDALKVPAERIALLRDDEATLEKMRRTVAKEALQAKAGGTLWFVFIGHGAPSKDGKDGLLVGADAPPDADGLYARGMSRAELLSLLSKGRQARTVVLLDAAFSGRLPWGAALVAGLQSPAPTGVPPGKIDGRTILLAAAQVDQSAGSLPKADRMRPAFSYLVLGALRGWAADPEGRVTASAAVDFARRALALDKGSTQIPALALELRRQGFHAVDLSSYREPRLDVFSLEDGSASGTQREVARAIYAHLQEKGISPKKHAWRFSAHDPTADGTWGNREWKRIERLRRRRE